MSGIKIGNNEVITVSNNSVDINVDRVIVKRLRADSTGGIQGQSSALGAGYSPLENITPYIYPGLNNPHLGTNYGVVVGAGGGSTTFTHPAEVNPTTATIRKRFPLNVAVPISVDTDASASSFPSTDDGQNTRRSAHYQSQTTGYFSPSDDDGISISKFPFASWLTTSTLSGSPTYGRIKYGNFFSSTENGYSLFGSSQGTPYAPIGVSNNGSRKFSFSSETGSVNLFAYPSPYMHSYAYSASFYFGWISNGYDILNKFPFSSDVSTRTIVSGNWPENSPFSPFAEVYGGHGMTSETHGFMQGGIYSSPVINGVPYPIAESSYFASFSTQGQWRKFSYANDVKTTGPYPYALPASGYLASNPYLLSPYLRSAPYQDFRSPSIMNGASVSSPDYGYYGYGLALYYFSGVGPVTVPGPPKGTPSNIPSEPARLYYATIQAMERFNFINETSQVYQLGSIGSHMSSEGISD